MPKTNLLQVDIASHSIQGLKDNNEDAVGFFVPQESEVLEGKGIVFAVADGVSSAEAGKEASNTAITRFLSDYYQTPDTWSVKHAGQKILSSINLTLLNEAMNLPVKKKVI